MQCAVLLTLLLQSVFAFFYLLVSFAFRNYHNISFQFAHRGTSGTCADYPSHWVTYYVLNESFSMKMKEISLEFAGNKAHKLQYLKGCYALLLVAL